MSFICLVIEKKEISQFSARCWTADLPIFWFNTPSEYRRDPHSYEYYWTKKIQACIGFEPMSSIILVQCSTNWANRPIGSWLLCWLQINPPSGEYMTENMWKSYKCTEVEETNIEVMLAVMSTTEWVVKIRLEKIQACTGFKPMSYSEILSKLDNLQWVCFLLKHIVPISIILTDDLWLKKHTLFTHGLYLGYKQLNLFQRV